MQATAHDLRRSQRSMSIVRWVGAGFAAVQVLAYDTEPYPSPAYRTTGLALAAALAVGNLGIVLAERRTSTLAGARRVGIAGLALDLIVASGFVWLYAFDQLSALWTVLFIIPLEGAIVFGLPGALLTWGTTAAIYTLREIWGATQYPADYPVGVQWSSVSFRMGIALLIAMVAGLMSRDLTRQRAQLRTAYDELSRLDDLRAGLVSTLAHDVRNPLTAIRGSIKLLTRHGNKVDEATRGELLMQADHQAARLERLAGDLLDLARLEGGRLDLQLRELDLRQLIEESLGFADPEGRYEIRVEPGLTVRADPGRLEQIVVNLAANALRYGEPPFVVEATRSDGTADLALRDHGPGIPPEEAALLFEPFRAEQDAGSVGLGLAIVKALTEAHGGSVVYEPNRPKGACFHVVLPIAGPPEVPAGSS